MFPYDLTVLEAVRQTPQSVADVIRIMGDIALVTVDGDGLKWFNSLYLEVTQAVAARVAANQFTKPEWIAQLDVQFAALYFSALDSSLSGQPCPECWQALFDRRNQVATARIQFALAGINAHINHDLPLAIVATCKLTGLVPQDSGAEYTDYTSLNSTLDGIIEPAKKTLHVRLLGDPLPPVTHVEDTIGAWSVSAAREAAWRNSELLWHLNAVPSLAAAFMQTLDGLTSVAGKTLLVPAP